MRHLYLYTSLLTETHTNIIATFYPPYKYLWLIQYSSTANKELWHIYCYCYVLLHMCIEQMHMLPAILSLCNCKLCRWGHHFILLYGASPFLDRPIWPSLGALCPSLWGLGPPPWPLTWGCPGLNCPAGPGCLGGPLGGMSSGIPEAPYISGRRPLVSDR